MDERPNKEKSAVKCSVPVLLLPNKGEDGAGLTQQSVCWDGFSEEFLNTLAT